jgi:hypothetical protein
MLGIDEGSRTGRRRGKSMTGGVSHRDHAARLHRVADDGGVMNRLQNRSLNMFTLTMSSA